MTNIKTSTFVRTTLADIYRRWPHNPNMARRGIPKGPVRWYLREWMATVPAYSARGGQAAMSKATGWSKATMSQLYNGTQDYSPSIIDAAAMALSVEPFELLMPPDRAMAIRGLRENAAVIVKTEPAAPAPVTTLTKEPEPKRRSG